MAKKKKEKVSGYILIKKAGYRIRKEASTFSEAIGVALKGEKITYLGITDKDWHKVDKNGTVGWVYKQAGELVIVEQKYLTVKKGNKWSIRTAPDGKATVIGTAKGGDKLLDQGESKNNYRLVIFENQNGWIHNRAIEKE